MAILQDEKTEQLMYDLIGEWLHNYHSSKSQSEKAKSKALIVSRMLPIVKRIARTIILYYLVTRGISRRY